MTETIHAYTLVTLEQMKVELDVETDDLDDDRLIRAANAATDFCETHTNRRLAQRASATTEDYDGCGEHIMAGGRQLWPIDWPLETGSITSIEDDITRAFDGSTYLINAAHYVIRYGRYIELSDIAGPQVFNENWQNIRLIYTPGYSTVPSDLAKAAALVALDFYRLEKQRDAALASTTQYGHSKSYRDYAVNPTAEEILKPYVRAWQEVPPKMARVP